MSKFLNNLADLLPPLKLPLGPISRRVGRVGNRLGILCTTFVPSETPGVLQRPARYIE